MSGRGIDFLEDWVHRNVTDDDRHGDRLRAAELAERCKKEAAVYGITIHDMEPELGSFETIIYEAMQNDMDAELEFWKTFAAARDRNATRHYNDCDQEDSAYRCCARYAATTRFWSRS